MTTPQRHLGCRSVFQPRFVVMMSSLAQVIDTHTITCAAAKPSEVLQWLVTRVSLYFSVLATEASVDQLLGLQQVRLVGVVNLSFKP